VMEHHWSSCAIYNEPAYQPEGCDCGGLDPAAYIRYRRIFGVVPDPGSLRSFVEDGELPSLIEAEQLPRLSSPASTASSNLECAQERRSVIGSADDVGFDDSCKAVVGEREALSALQSLTSNLPPHAELLPAESNDRNSTPTIDDGKDV
jgi:hypothetical protein